MKSRTKNRKSPDQLRRMVSHALRGARIAESDQAVVELEEGWFNAAYRITLGDGRRVIVKIAPRSDVDVLAYERNLMFTEVACMRRVAGHPGVPVAEVLHFDASMEVCDSPFFFMEMIEGDNFGHVKDTLNAAQREEAQQAIGRIVRAINDTTGDWFGYEGNPDLRAETWRDAFAKMFEAVLVDAEGTHARLGYSHAEIRTAFARHESALTEVRVPHQVHWDAWDNNFIHRNGAIVGILDFERALWGDPLMEAHFRLRTLKSGVTPYEHGYGKTRYTHQEDQRCNLYLLYLGLVMNTECGFRDYDSSYVFDTSKTLLDAAMQWLREH